MAKPRMDLSAFVGRLLEEQDGDVLREGIRVLSQALMESEVAGLIGAAAILLRSPGSPRFDPRRGDMLETVWVLSCSESPASGAHDQPRPSWPPLS